MPILSPLLFLPSLKNKAPANKQKRRYMIEIICQNINQVFVNSSPNTVTAPNANDMKMLQNVILDIVKKIEALLSTTPGIFILLRHKISRIYPKVNSPSNTSKAAPVLTVQLIMYGRPAKNIIKNSDNVLSTMNFPAASLNFMILFILN